MRILISFAILATLAACSAGPAAPVHGPRTAAAPRPDVRPPSVVVISRRPVPAPKAARRASAEDGWLVVPTQRARVRPALAAPASAPKAAPEETDAAPCPEPAAADPFGCWVKATPCVPDEGLCPGGRCTVP